MLAFHSLHREHCISKNMTYLKVVILRTFFSFEARIFEYLDVSEQKTSIIDNLHDKFKLTPIL